MVVSPNGGLIHLSVFLWLCFFCTPKFRVSPIVSGAVYVSYMVFLITVLDRQVSRLHTCSSFMYTFGATLLAAVNAKWLWERRWPAGVQ